jgi:hypothetical protein
VNAVITFGVSTPRRPCRSDTGGRAHSFEPGATTAHASNERALSRLLDRGGSSLAQRRPVRTLPPSEARAVHAQPARASLARARRALPGAVAASACRGACRLVLQAAWQRHLYVAAPAARKPPLVRARGWVGRVVSVRRPAGARPGGTRPARRQAPIAMKDKDRPPAGQGAPNPSSRPTTAANGRDVGPRPSRTPSPRSASTRDARGRGKRDTALAWPGRHGMAQERTRRHGITTALYATLCARATRRRTRRRRDPASRSRSPRARARCTLHCFAAWLPCGVTSRARHVSTVARGEGDVARCSFLAHGRHSTATASTHTHTADHPRQGWTMTGFNASNSVTGIAAVAPARCAAPPARPHLASLARTSPPRIAVATIITRTDHASPSSASTLSSAVPAATAAGVANGLRA